MAFHRPLPTCMASLQESQPSDPSGLLASACVPCAWSLEALVHLENSLRRPPWGWGVLPHGFSLGDVLLSRSRSLEPGSEGIRPCPWALEDGVPIGQCANQELMPGRSGGASRCTVGTSRAWHLAGAQEAGRQGTGEGPSPNCWILRKGRDMVAPDTLGEPLPLP